MAWRREQIDDDWRYVVDGLEVDHATWELAWERERRRTYERRVQQRRADFNAADWRPGLHVPGLETIGRASSLQVLLAIGRGIGPGEASMAAFGV